MERLTAREGRVLASLVEKQLTIPQHYPLTLNALVAACNQTSSREPVTALSQEDVLQAIESLKAKRMVRSVLPSHGRSAVRYRHVLDETLGLDPPQLSVLSVLDLRGPQTVAELRARTERMAPIDSVEHELELLASREDALVARVDRLPGQKEGRWESRLADPFPSSPSPSPGASGVVAGPDPLGGDLDDLRREVDSLRAELASVRTALDLLRSDLDELRTSLGG